MPATHLPQRPLKIAVLHPSARHSSAPFAALDPAATPAAYAPQHQWADIWLEKETAIRQVRELANQGYDVFFNLCDGAWEEDRPGIEVVTALEKLNLAFTGAGSGFYEPSRLAMKMAAASVGVKFPAYVMARKQDDVQKALSILRFPMLVKHPNSYSSIGLTPQSRVTTPSALREQLAIMLETYGSALIEEFIEGREFTVLVTEPTESGDPAWALEPVEFRFPVGESFKHFSLKWEDFRGMDTGRVEDEALNNRLKDASRLIFEALGGSGYGRCDLRVDGGGEVYLLEINPNCGIFYPEGQSGSADHILALDTGHTRFIDHLLGCALRRQSRGTRRWEIAFSPPQGFGLVATTDIREGERVVCYEEQRCGLVSGSYVQAHWRGLKREWFGRYGWPLGEDLWGIWSENPEDWRPINHSCDPCLWFVGLDLVARRDISVGEDLTLDYAMFCGPGMEPFVCGCQTGLCRGQITGQDYLLPGLQERYRGHVSGWVASQDSPEERQDLL